MRRIESLLRFPRVILPQRLHRVRHITFSTAFQCPLRPLSETPRDRHRAPPDDPAKWQQACQVLASFQHLEDLHVTLAFWSRSYDRRGPVDEESVVFILKRLNDVRAKRFVVTVTEDVSEQVRKQLGWTPFVILKRNKPGVGHDRYKSDD